MFITINPKQAATSYVLYSLKAPNGDVVHMGVVPWSQLTALTELPERPDVDLYLSVVDQDADRVKLINRGVAYCHENGLNEMRDRLNQQFVSWSRNKRGRPVVCNETGEQFQSATACARQHDLTYGQLLKHLQGEKSYQTVKAKTYRYA